MSTNERWTCPSLLHNKVRDDTITKRVPTVPNTAVLITVLANEDDYRNEPTDEIYQTFALGQPAEKTLPKDSLIIPDPIKFYYNSLSPGEKPSLDRLTVAKESTAIRSILALVDTCLVMFRPGLAQKPLALAFSRAGPSQSQKSWLGLGLARPKPWLLVEKIDNLTTYIIILNSIIM
jgi:hypothetical protein